MFLDPTKMLVISIVALIVIGPDKHPKMARTAGALWHEFKQLRQRLEEEVRGTFPDLPPTHEIAAVIRTPMSVLDRLAQDASQPADLDRMPAEATAPPEGTTLVTVSPAHSVRAPLPSREVTLISGVPEGESSSADVDELQPTNTISWN